MTARSDACSQTRSDCERLRPRILSPILGLYGCSQTPSYFRRLGPRVVSLMVLLFAIPSYAEVERYAVIVGHDVGAADEQKLRFAESDAQRVGELLGEVGGVRDENRIVLRGKTADQVRRALIATNERIRTSQRAGREAMLIVYYSGHGDADALHLGGTRFDLRELEALVRGSSAGIRVLVIDSCRSGAVTRVKGGKPGAPIVLAPPPEAPGEGVIVLTASTAGEDAQESDQLAGSFFTHFLLSALRGAADDNRDQSITVAEAFTFTREQTILASSRTLAGTQHPTFHYDLRGRADVVLADLGSDKTRGRLTLPDGATYLVMRETGGVVGEIVAGVKQRTLSLPRGTYKVRGRAREALLEGKAIVVATRETIVQAGTLERIEYARLVRKGGADVRDHVSGWQAGVVMQTPIIDGGSPCLGVLAGWAFVRHDLTLSPRVIGCRGGFENRTLTASTDLVAAELELAKAWDVSRFTVDVGVTAGGELLLERFESRGTAPSRTSGAGFVGASAGLAYALGPRLHAGTEVAAQTHFFSVEEQSGARSLATRFALRIAIGLGGWF